MNELQAWAAGFFDGEGNTSYSKENHSLRVSITQNDPEVLVKFMDAVGVGKVYGPYTTKPNLFWCYQVSGKPAVVVLSRIWFWLGAMKRSQAISKLELYTPSYRCGTKDENRVCSTSGCNRLGQRKSKNGIRRPKCRRCYESV